MQLLSSFNLKSIGNINSSKTIYNHTVDICSYRARPRGGDQIFKFIYDQATTKGHLPRGCPVSKGLYYIKDYAIDENMFPSFIPLPEATSKLVTNFYTNIGKKLHKIVDSAWKVAITKNI